MPNAMMTAREALAAYEALDPRDRAVLDSWIAHAVQPAGRYHPVTRAEFEELLYPCPYVSATEFNGALIAHGYQPQDPDSVRYATSFKARVRREVRAATYERAPAPRWLPQVQALAQTTVR